MAPHRRRESVINKTTTHDGERSIIQDENSRNDNLKDKFIGAIDQGTTSTRFIVFDGTGLPVASYQSEFRQIHAHSGYVNLQYLGDGIH
jgi:glycerol kinase